MRHRLSRTALLSSLFFLAAVPNASACSGADASPEAGAKQARAAVVCLVNEERRARGLKTVTRNRALAGAARRHAADMVARGYFAHDTPEGVSPQVRAAAYVPASGEWTVGENLAWGAAGNATPRVIVRNWMQSPAHRENVLRPVFREIGLGIVAGSPRGAAAGAFTYAASFGSR